MSGPHVAMRSPVGIDIRICAWAGPLACVFFVASLLVAMRFVPPLPPTLTAEQIAAIYRSNGVGIKIGAVFMVLATTLLMPWTAAISAALERADKPVMALSKTQMISGVIAFAPLMYASFLFAAGAYRAERADASIYMLNDMAWIFLVMTPGMIQPLAIGLAIMMDRSADPLFPRWLGYMNLWFALLFTGGVVNPLFKTGLLAWNGLVAFWIPAGIFSIWVISMMIGLLAAARKLEARDNT